MLSLFSFLEDTPVADPVFWVVVGFVGQLIFGARFLVQWLASERAGKTVVPPIFWMLSIFGSVIVLCYAIHKRDPVFIVSNVGGLLIYSRSLVLMRRETAEGSGSSS